MKKVCLTFTIGLIALFSSANPVYVPTIYVSKFFFDENQKWEIIMTSNSTALDSILISSSTGQSMCRKMSQSLIYSNYSIVIRTDSLDTNLNINPEGDSITLISYYNGSESSEGLTNETIVYGNYKNSTIPKPAKGQSIVAFWTDGSVPYYHCLSDSSANLKGTLHGHVYDKNNGLITSGSVIMSPFEIPVSCSDALSSYGFSGIDINADGTYSTKLYAVKYNLDTIGISIRDSCTGGVYYSKVGSKKITPINFSIQPDSSIELDVYLLEDITGINEVKSGSNEPLQIFPNPIHANYFHYEISTPVKSTHCFINLLNINGQTIESYSISENSGDLNLPVNISNGTYLLQLQMNNEAYLSKQIILSGK
jgi:hypothetical protein